MSINPDDIPEGHPLRAVFAAQLEAQGAHELRAAEMQARADAFFKELSVEHLTFFWQLCHDISHIPSAHAQVLAGYYQGLSGAVLKYVHNVCPECGENHEERDLQQLLEQPKGEPTE